MIYNLVIMGGRVYEITETERGQVLGKNGFIHIPRLQLTINSASISAIEPKGLSSTVDRSKQLEGMTPDGEHVIKRFGRWYIANPASPYQYDENGNSILVYDGHPLLPTPEEYEREFRMIPASLWTERLLPAHGDGDDRLLLDRSNRTTQGGFEKIGAPNLTREDIDV